MKKSGTLRSLLVVLLALLVLPACTNSGLEKWRVGASFSIVVDDANSAPVLTLLPDDAPEDTLIKIVEEPKHGVLEWVSQEAGLVRYMADPEYFGPDSFSFTLTANGTTSALRTINLTISPPEPITNIDVSQNPLLNKTIVLYNSNARDAQEIANYYVAQRKMPTSALCSVRLPPGGYAKKEELLGARRTIVEDCICPLIPEGQRPNPCTLANINEIAEKSPISHMVIVKGVPHRLFSVGWPIGGQDPSFDFYLAVSLYRPESEIFGPGTTGLLSGPRYTSQSGSGGLVSEWGMLQVPVDPARDRMVVYGRVEAMTTERTKALIERTLDSERKGFTGNVVEASKNAKTTSHLLRGFVRSTSQQCLTYNEASPALEWPYEDCRAGIGSDEIVPARSGSLARAVNVGLFYGSNPYPNGQAAFNGDFNRLLGWRKTASACTPLCREFPTLEEQTACKARSSDIFKELNTDCVGVGRGFMGHQTRSYTVSYYGMFPQGWMAHGGGDIEKTPPVRLEGDAYQDSVFQDNYFLRFGDTALTSDSRCLGQDGSEQQCLERVPLYIYRSQPVNVLLAGTSSSYSARFRLRYRVKPGTPGKFHLRIRFQDEYFRPFVKEGGGEHFASTTVIAANGSGGWESLEVEGAASAVNLPPADDKNPAGTVLKYAQLSLESSLTDDLRGMIDIDAAEAFSLPGETSLIPISMGSFALPYEGNYLTSGDYAANVIDRLGGIAFWGSGGHHITGGWGFSSSAAHFASLTSGRSLGESVQVTGGGESGTLYGDPLYSPLAVRLYVDKGHSGRFGSPLEGELGKWFDVVEEDFGKALPIRFDAFNGRAMGDHLKWEIDICSGGPKLVTDCDRLNLWRTVKRGERPTKGAAFGLRSEGLFSHPHAFVRLKIWNVGEESDALYSYLQLRYKTPIVFSVSGSTWMHAMKFSQDIGLSQEAILLPIMQANRFELTQVPAALLNSTSIEVTGKFHSYTLTVLEKTSQSVTYSISPALNVVDELTVKVTDGKRSKSFSVLVLPGDVNVNGVIEADDLNTVTLVITMALEGNLPSFLSKTFRARVDINGDGELTQADIDVVSAAIASGDTTISQEE